MDEGEESESSMIFHEQSMPLKYVSLLFINRHADLLADNVLMFTEDVKLIYSRLYL